MFGVINKLIVVSVILFLQGCIAPIKYQTAVPQIPASIEGKIHKNLVEINLPELMLSVQVQAFDWDGQYLLPPLGVWVNIEPLNSPLMLKTIQVKLKSDDDEVISAVSYLGPSVKWFSPRALAAGCGPRIYKLGIGLTRIGVSPQSVMNANNEVGIYRPSEKPIRIDNDSCFMFWFDTDSLPNHTFVLSISGLALNGKEIIIPNLHFKKGTIQDIRGFP